jgi:hypothetical protein
MSNRPQPDAGLVAATLARLSAATAASVEAQATAIRLEAERWALAVLANEVGARLEQISAAAALTGTKQATSRWLRPATSPGEMAPRNAAAGELRWSARREALLRLGVEVGVPSSRLAAIIEDRFPGQLGS